MSERDRRTVELIQEAERLGMRSRPEPEILKWLKTRCPECGYKIEYSPKNGFTGRLRCPECGYIFKVSRLNYYLKEDV
mgnify:CR=1 FL=1